jgi:hypothetical protein
MSKLVFDGNSSWFVSPDSKYGLSKMPAKNITDDDFSFLTKMKVDWDKMNPDDISREGGVIIKNGLHMGLSVIKPDMNHCYIKATVWTTDPDFDTDNKMRNWDILVKVNWEDNDLTKEYEVGMSFKKSEKEFSVYCNGTWYTEKYEGTLIDYSNAWLWIGSSNPLESCPIDFKQFFYGEIYKIGIFAKALDREEIIEVYNNFTDVSKRLKPMGLFNFERQTPYKVLDISGCGNNLVKFDVTWMDSI